MSSPREPLTRERIIDTALHIVDGQGLSRLTMRRLGDALQVEAMAIYHHLPRGKEELLDGLVAHVGVLPLLMTRRNPVALAETTASLREVLRMAGFLDAAAAAGAHTLLGYVIGHAALEARGKEARRPDDPDEIVDWDRRFTLGLDVVLAGLLTLP